MKKLRRSLSSSIVFLICLVYFYTPMKEMKSFESIVEVLDPAETDIRVPAEWETHSATWMQWPGEAEAHMRDAFVRIIAVVSQYEPVYLIVNDTAMQKNAEVLLADAGIEDNVFFYRAPIDNAWLRDNGPIYVTNGEEIFIQDWGFDGWDASLKVPFENDDVMPSFIAEQLMLPVLDYNAYVLEKGNLEVNGEGVALINWDCQSERNPGLTQAEHEMILKERLGLKEIIWAYGHYREDITTGHIDGIARFVNADTVLVANYGTKIETNFAKTLEEKNYTVIWYPGDPNWLVGNGFVAAVSTGNAEEDAVLKEILEDVFPNRDVHMIAIASITKSGGGIHCVTNEQVK